MLPCRSDVPDIASQFLDGTSRHPGSVRQLETATHLAIHEHAIQIPFGNKTKPRKRAVPVLAEIALGNCGSRTTMELIKTSVARCQSTTCQGRCTPHFGDKHRRDVGEGIPSRTQTAVAAGGLCAARLGFSELIVFRLFLSEFHP
jgi:hypothetical protein